MLGRVLAGTIILAIGALFLPTMLRKLTDSFLFYPERGQWRTPRAVGLPFEEVWLEVDGARVQAWWVAGEARGPAVVMFHGNAGTIADRVDFVAQMVARLDVSVLQVEYPGYGDSGGRPTEVSLLATGMAGVSEGKARAGGRPLVAFGRSLGGAVALDAAARSAVDAVVAESTFTNLREMAGASGIPMARRLVAYRFDSLSRARELRSPLLLIHGDRDEVVPYEMSRRLLEAAGSSEKRLHTVRGGRHNDTWVVGGEDYWRAWSGFLAGVTTGGSREP